MKIDSWFLHDYDMAMKEVCSRGLRAFELSPDELFRLAELRAWKAEQQCTQEVWDAIDAHYTMFDHVDEPICSHLIDKIEELLNEQ